MKKAYFHSSLNKAETAISKYQNIIPKFEVRKENYVSVHLLYYHYYYLLIYFIYSSNIKETSSLAANSTETLIGLSSTKIKCLVVTFK